MEALLQIDGKVMPTPGGMTVRYQDLDSSDTGRAANGEMIRERVRSGVRTLEINWKALYADEMSLLLNALEPAFVNVRFFDPKTASFQNATMYSGDRPAVFYTLRDDQILYTDFTISLIEK